MAEAIAMSLGHVAISAGTHPGESVNPNAIRVLEEIGIDCSKQFPKNVDDITSEGHDKIISMGCGVECPNLPIDADWGLEDPHGKSLETYRTTRDRIIKFVKELVQKGTDA